MNWIYRDVISIPEGTIEGQLGLIYLIHLYLIQINPPPPMQRTACEQWTNAKVKLTQTLAAC